MSVVTREAWLESASEALAYRIGEHGATVPPIRVSFGWPTSRSAIGQCFHPSMVADARPALFISPALDDAVDILSTLLHELIHAALPPEAKHGAPFSRLAKTCGLLKPWTATTPSDGLKRELTELADTLGPLAHSKVDRGGIKRQSTRMLKLECGHCGYVVRTTRKWLDTLGNPLCPSGERMVETS